MNMSFHPIEHLIIVNMITILYSTLVLQLAPTEIVYQCIVKPSRNTIQLDLIHLYRIHNLQIRI